MFRLATCDDLIKLKSIYQDCWYNGDRAWGLKQLGTLFCVDVINKKNASRLLEVGAGLNLFFNEKYGNTHDYWMIDQAVFYNKEVFKKVLKTRRNTKFVDSLIGKFSNELHNDYFDLVFSISVLEHIPQDAYDNICNDMYRVLKPGGYIAHSFDVYPTRLEKSAKKFLKAIKRAGFKLEEKARLQNFDLAKSGRGILLEPLSIVYQYYGGNRDDLWTNTKKIHNYHNATVLILAQKPLI